MHLEDHLLLADVSGRIPTCEQNTLHAHLFESVDAVFEEQCIAISSMADRDPVLTADKEQSEAFLSSGMNQEEADCRHDMEATVQASDGS